MKYLAILLFLLAGCAKPHLPVTTVRPAAKSTIDCPVLQEIRQRIAADIAEAGPLGFDFNHRFADINTLLFFIDALGPVCTERLNAAKEKQ